MQKRGKSKNNGVDEQYPCLKCNGSGTIEMYGSERMIEKCPCCKGSGKVDWVTNITQRGQ